MKVVERKPKTVDEMEARLSEMRAVYDALCRDSRRNEEVNLIAAYALSQVYRDATFKVLGLIAVTEHEIAEAKRRREEG